MAASKSRDRYTKVAIVLHWVIALLVMFMLPFGRYMTDLPKGSFERLAAYQAHFSVGITILVLSIARLVWRLAHPAPKLPATMKTWEKALAKTVHYLFYLLLIIIPLAGWATATTSPLSVPIYFFELFQWPWFPGIHEAQSKKILYQVFKDLHVTLGWAMIGLIALHVLAVFKHTLIDQDGTFQKMLPSQKMLPGQRIFPGKE